MKSRIDHNGVIESIEGNHIRVKILQASACSSCQAKTLCASADTKEKIIDVWDSDASKYKVGESVLACGSLSMGKNAVILAFLIPLIIIILWMVVALKWLMLSELMAIGGLFILLIIYYAILSALKSRLSRTFAFWIERPES